mmetsp:Transcript_18033/g.29853  ORF Transcript_18033/g.29853 Transcript_18033/m.29853 type:complete len:269 (+) Transcript_18033:146-952(+)
MRFEKCHLQNCQKKALANLESENPRLKLWEGKTLKPRFASPFNGTKYYNITHDKDRDKISQRSYSPDVSEYITRTLLSKEIHKQYEDVLVNMRWKKATKRIASQSAPSAPCSVKNVRLTLKDIERSRDPRVQELCQQLIGIALKIKEIVKRVQNILFSGPPSSPPVPPCIRDIDCEPKFKYFNHQSNDESCDNHVLPENFNRYSDCAKHALDIKSESQKKFADPPPKVNLECQLGGGWSDLSILPIASDAAEDPDVVVEPARKKIRFI